MQGVCVLKDLYNNDLYQLDDQQEAHRYSGKLVTVTGMLDKASETILVESIRPANPRNALQSVSGAEAQLTLISPP
jgi:hypothetical protein